MDFVDEKYVARLEIGENPHQVEGPGERGARCLDQARAHLLGDDVGKGGFAQPGRAVKKNVAHRFAACGGGVEGDLELIDEILLADVLIEPGGAERGENPLLRRADFPGRDAPFDDHGDSFTA